MKIKRSFTEVSQLQSMRDGFIALFGFEPQMRINRGYTSAVDRSGTPVFFSTSFLVTHIEHKFITVKLNGGDEAQINIRDNMAQDATPFKVIFSVDQ